MTSSTVSSESAPRSSTNDDSFLISASLTPSCSATIFLTRCSTLSITILPAGIPFVLNRPILPDTRELPKVAHCEMTLLPATWPQLGHVHATIDVQRRPRDVASCVRRQKGNGMGNILRRTKAAQGNALEQRVALRVGQRACHLGVDEPGCDAIHGNVAAADFLRERLGKTDQCRLRRRIVGL